ncbi:MAG: caspase family protein [Saprospiraceae bacterium]
MCILLLRESYAERFAIVVGAGNYLPSSGLPKSLADSDAEKVANVLLETGWTVTLMNGNRGGEYYPTSDNILRFLGLTRNTTDNGIGFSPENRFCGKTSLSDDDVLLFYWGGHGITSDDGYNCIVPLDVVKTSNRIGGAQNLIRIQWVQQALANTGAGTILLFIDASRYPDNVKFGHLTPNFRVVSEEISDVHKNQPVNPRQSIFTMKSTADGSFAHEPTKLGMSVFVHFFIQALTQKDEQVLADRSDDGKITIEELARYVQQNTFRWVKTLMNNHGDQMPQYGWTGPEKPELVLTHYSREGFEGLDNDLVKALTPVIYDLNNEDCSDFRGKFIAEEIPFFLRDSSNKANITDPLKCFKTSSKARGFSYRKIEFTPTLYSSGNDLSCLIIYFSDSRHHFSEQEALIFIKYFQSKFPDLYWDIIDNPAQAGYSSFGWKGFARASVEDRNTHYGGEDSVEHVFDIMYHNGQLGIVFH